MAASPMMRQAMATWPRSGSFHSPGAASAGTAMASVVMARSLSLVAAVRIFRMFQVPQRPAARHHRDGREVVRRRWRADRPLEGPGVPRVLAGRRPLPVRPDEIDDEHD